MVQGAFLLFLPSAKNRAEGGFAKLAFLKGKQLSVK
jgi:hypothetical protein